MPNAPQRSLTQRDAIAIIVGLVIGAGIFKTPSIVAGMAGDSGWILLTWLAGALISLAGALCYAELCAANPHAGGDYHFLVRAYGKHVSFLYAWAKAMVEYTAPLFWLFLLMVGLSVFVLRRKEGLAHRLFKVPLYPLTPLVFCAACGYLSYSSMVYAASQSAAHVSSGLMFGFTP